MQKCKLLYYNYKDKSRLYNINIGTNRSPTNLYVIYIYIFIFLKYNTLVRDFTWLSESTDYTFNGM